MFGLPWFDLIVAPVYARSEEGTRERLLKAAGWLVDEGGPPALTVEAVTRRAHVSRGALRYHFGGKRGLMEALVRARHGQAATLRAALAWKRGQARVVRLSRRPRRSRVLPRVRAAG